jgi:hypothetical protein
LYKEYIDNDKYVYYKDNNNIIILEKNGDAKMNCVSNIEPKKYRSMILKPVLIFQINDPYKLIIETGEYKIDKTITSYCYKNIEEVILSDKLLTHTGKYQKIINLQKKDYF